MITIKGKQVSEEIVELALKEYFKTHKTKVPIISFAQYNELRDRVVINLTPKMIERIKDGDQQITIASTGGVADSKRENYNLQSCYSNQEPIFGKIEE